MRQVNLLMIIIASFLFVGNVFAETPGRTEYEVGLKDILSINVLDHNEMSSIATVAADGSITLPYIGALYVKDKVLSDIQKEITKKLSEGYIKFPVVTVTLVQSVIRQIYVYGEVGRPGVFPYEEQMTILNALSFAGGIRENGFFSHIKLRRKKENKSLYNEIYIGTKYALENTNKGDMVLEPDDILIVERNKTFLIQGEVASRGRFMLERNMTILKALLKAGGVTDNGRYGIIKLRRTQGVEEGQYEDIIESKLNDGVIDSKEVEDMVLQSDDVLIVERNKTFLMQGAIGKPARYTLERDMTILSAILNAGGVTDNGRYGKISLRRKQKAITGEYADVVEVKLKNGVIENSEVEDMVLKPDDILIVKRNDTFIIHGEVGRTGEYVLEDGMNVTKAISIAGGIRSDGLYGNVKIRRNQDADPGYYDILIDFRNAIEGNVADDLFLQSNDILIVERNKTYFVYGEVNRPGEYTLKDDITVFQAIIIAGGFTKWGSDSNVKVLRSQKGVPGVEMIEINVGKVIGGNADADSRLQTGDTIVVSSRIF